MVPSNCTYVSFSVSVLDLSAEPIINFTYSSSEPSDSFELCDLDQMPIPYPDNHFDFIHARSVHVGVRFVFVYSILLSKLTTVFVLVPSILAGSPPRCSPYSVRFHRYLLTFLTNQQIRDYPRFLKEIARILRPGGLVLLIEPSLHPVFSNTSIPVAAPQHPNPPSLAPPLPPLPPSQQGSPSQTASTSLAANVSSNIIAETTSISTAPTSTAADPGTGSGDITPQIGEQRGWVTFWETYRACLRSQGIDTSVPERLPDLLSATGQFENIIVQKGNIPVGFWPQGALVPVAFCIKFEIIFLSF